MKLFVFSLLLSFLFPAFATAQKFDYRVSEIPDSLKENAYSVVRFIHHDYQLRNPLSAVSKYRTAITVLDKSGLNHSYFIEAGNKFTKLKSFKAIVMDANGKKIKTYNKSNIETNAISAQMATDYFNYILGFTPPIAPFTVYYEYEIEMKDGIIVFPAFVPLSTYNQSVQQASFRLTVPESIAIHIKELNYSGEYKKNEQKGLIQHHWKIGNLKAVENETFSPALRDLIPLVFSAPVVFEYEKTKGELTNTATYVSWQNELIRNRTELNQATKDHIVSITAGLETDREKVEALYNYMGNTTRYVSIQLGIGGFQPIAAAEVCRTGFGDCKGLSNYLKAMLNHIGIEANLCVIRSDYKRKDLSDDFTDFMATNHMILQVPLSGDTLWLECTNTKVPFGYVHNDIAGHHAQVCYDTGGKLERLPDYPDSLNIESNKLMIKLDEDGKAVVDAIKSWEIKQYDRVMHILTARQSEQTDFLRKAINLPQVDVRQMQFSENRSTHPSIVSSYQWNTNEYGNRTGNRLFIPVNTVRSLRSYYQKTKRRHDIQIYEGFANKDEIIILIPEGYVAESIPSGVSVNNEFGTFNSEIKIDQNRIIIQQDLLIHSGKWPSSSWEELTRLLTTAETSYNSRIILRKTS